ncbi:bifunctional 5,10-methylenetetrahydrofolate dehydrogenase/5,10-methenyltetrahydrofolate cyclohydrolase [Candidatus Peregrinibacteria bacterium]|jgi:methylenetetrahydrofolate dehydrogenase (NADP+) / methenyltetrahydrofolate cyclohydrolase|nr:bifunctional 5,10-methylenetetrahydrofolate dehydrogenase/5,10-methenyltetrahydrofolate cyclohydrolase [Candidatus Peregrinibacteria bacterium]MBT3598452.1 bifunctional 5,10-methylenetetrahydrofolate dehydrogenase/5,10-methenyltetrahydrofolate cyclohydrolase [Candidatus Peregrinibacteria bacterium]MBT4367113.1 bifunctional 5,10-methylenetetrahydrofolate dehydrogenase/5,10-methenyltetrahydrofolate cyclohydrolase [Candidatus Peregrinibacteria bacterium]MBT6730879.1 bifunctional 5,10-methylenete
MSALLLDGRLVAAELLTSLQKDVADLDPKLVVVQVGEDPASSSYIRQKIKSCDAVKMRHQHLHLPEETNLDDLMTIINDLNNDDDVTGFIVQLPLPKHLNEFVPQIIRQIDPKKDVDGFSAYNIGKMFLSTEFEHLPPATPSGVITLLEHYDIPFEGKNVTVVGHSNTVGKPLTTMFLNRNATVTTCNVYTKDLAHHTKDADILCVAVGKPNLITADMVKDGVVVVDIGITKTENGLCGDVDFEAVKEKAYAISPVPGGVGPMTVASLIRNCVRAKKRQLELS